MSPLVSLLRLRLLAAGRAAREQAAVWLILAPMIGTVALLLLSRLATDLERLLSGVSWQPLVWALALLAALVVGRRPLAGDAIDLVAVQPLSATALRFDVYLGGLLRVLPVVVLAAVLLGVHDWPGLLAMWLLTPLWAILWVGQGATQRLGNGWRRLTGRVCRLLSRPLPDRLRPLVWRDLIWLSRAGGTRFCLYLALSAVAFLGLLEQAVSGAENHRLAALAVLLSSWALSALVVPLLVAQQHGSWNAWDAGLSAATLWDAKLASATLLGGLPGLCGALVWLPVSPLEAVLWPFLGMAVGLCSGMVMMEGDGRPVLHGVVSLLLSLICGALVVLHPLFLVLPTLLVGYLRRVGVPRLENRLREWALAV